MKLMTKEIENKLKKYPLYSQDGKGMDAIVTAKFFNPYGAGTWYVTEGEKQLDGDWLFFGYADVLEGELGYFSLSELESIRPFRGMQSLGIERDKYTDMGKPLSNYIN